MDPVVFGGIVLLVFVFSTVFVLSRKVKTKNLLTDKRYELVDPELWDAFEAFRSLPDKPITTDQVGRWLGATVARERAERKDAEALAEGLQHALDHANGLCDGYNQANSRLIQERDELNRVIETKDEEIQHLAAVLSDTSYQLFQALQVGTGNEYREDLPF